eukprot:m.13631 g.13631  ORF g.13631 m.13631 type:complete len:4451 (+) comp5977_c0_seq1:73-13425(+)
MALTVLRWHPLLIAVACVAFALVPSVGAVGLSEDQGGNIYTRWGRQDCGPDSLLVYPGVAGSAYHGHSGSGGNLQCMPLEPEYVEGTFSQGSSSTARLYRVEFFTNDAGIASLKRLDRSEVACAVCQRKSTTAKTLMVAGTYQCPSGFKLDYDGYLFAPHTSHQRGEHVCIDREANNYGSFGGEDGHRLYPVETAGGSSAVPGYTASYEVTCAVCSSTGGAVFTRWGKSSCPSTSSQVYKGVGAAPHYTHGGSGTNQLCMINVPKYRETSGSDQGGAQLYRMEYQTSANKLSNTQGVNDYDVVCSVCQAASSQPYSLIIPGRTTCPSGWREEFQGYLMAENTGHYRSNFVCMDQYPEAGGSSGNENGGLLYHVEIAGGVHNKAYQQYSEVACVQCTGSSLTYVNHGRDSCESGSTRLYAGWLAGSHYTHSGSGSQRICMHDDPQYLQYNSGDAGGAQVYQTEYETSGSSFPAWTRLHDREARCSVCARSGTQSGSLMIPARKSCPNGMTMDYWGMLMSEHYTHKKSQFVCVNNNAQLSGSTSNDNGALFYFTEADTANGYILPGYLQGHELPCIVCRGTYSPPPPPPPPDTTSGPTFVRWGRSDCPSSSRLVYTGFAGGEYYNHGGSGSNLQCMPFDPDTNQGMFDTQDRPGSLIYHAEYQTSSYGILSMRVLHDQEVPCAVCKRIIQTSTTLMVPGTNKCPSGFSADYQGYLFAPHHTHHRGEYVCIDKDATSIGSVSSEDGHLLYPVEAGSGAASIPGYTTNLELTCVVCGSERAGAVYTRWGRTSCSPGATSVYRGTWGGAYYDHRGGGANNLCLVQYPTYVTSNMDAGNNDGSKIYRAEYQMSDAVNEMRYLHDYDAVCVICQAPETNPFKLMLPGRFTCPAGMRQEYFGYLASEHTSHRRRQWVCLDRDPELSGSKASENGALIYLTEMGNPAFSGYLRDYELTCAICTHGDGPTYTRIGRTSCPGDSTLVYRGMVGGSYYSHSGSGSGTEDNSQMCMHPEPEYKQFNAGGSNGAQVYRGEYQTSDSGAAIFQKLQNHDVPCAICQLPRSRTHKLTVPGKLACPGGFQVEYTGVMMSEKNDHQKSTYVCVDENPESGGTPTDENGLLFYATEMQTANGRIRPEYAPYQELPCVECSGYASGKAPPSPPPPPPPRATGEIFTTWGRRDCPTGSNLVYNGFAAGSHYSHSGSGAMLQCMPDKPEYAEGFYSEQDNPGGIMYNAEYRTKNTGMPSNIQALDFQEVPCSVCQIVADKAKVLMQPGSYVCPSGFNQLYKGYLFSPKHDQSRGEHICLHENAHGYGSTGNEAGHLLYPVETHSGSDALPGYTAFYEVTCTVCASSKPGAVFQRWGKTACPSGTTRVYEGIMAGPHYTHGGGGANALCMTKAPKYLHTSGTDQEGGILYRTEYEMTGAQNSLGYPWTSLNDRDATCSVCQSRDTNEFSLMVPGRITCPANYDKEYRGYLMALHTSHKRSEFVCVDESPDISGSTNNENGNLLYFTEMSGSPFSGYSQYQEVACVMCTGRSRGSTFVHYGQSTCPSTSTKLFNGWIGGSYYQHGGGYQYLPLHPEPEYLKFHASDQGGAQLYRGEYQMSDAVGPSGQNLRALHDKDVPYALCERPASQSVAVTIPGVFSCDSIPGFFQTYRGYLVSEHHTHHPSNFVCLAENPISIGSAGDQNGALFYPVEMQPVGNGWIFPQYVQNRELSCVVCEACSAGTFISSSGCKAFSTCSAGKYQTTAPTLTSDRSCSNCPAGTYQPQTNTATSCNGCSSVTYQNQVGQASCKSCSTGYYRSSATAQTRCQAGYKCSNCQRTACSAGTYQASTGQTSCIACSSSEYQDQTAQSSCKSCSVGYYRNSASSQTKCPAGSRCPGSCAKQACPAGTYQGSTGQTSCTTCSSTTYQDQTGQTSCKSCSPGYYRSSASAQSKCQAGYQCSNCQRTACTSGKYQNSAGQTSCKAISTCGAGQYVSTSATASSDTVCSSCASNTYQSSTSHLKTSCVPRTICAEGKYQKTAATATSDTVCVACDGTTQYQDRSGQLSCKAVTKCSYGQYQSRAPTASTNRQCSSCSLGLGYMDLSSHTQTSCKSVSDACSPGQYQSVSFSLSNDRSCTTCPSNTFSNKIGASSCDAHTTCNVGTYQLVAPTTSTDRICASCNGITEYQDQAGQTSCKTVTTCASGLYSIAEPTSKTNRVCRTCTKASACNTNQYLAGSCGGLSNTYCASCHSTCATCTGPANSQCKTCATGLVFDPTTGKCTSNCVDGQYKDSSSNCRDCNTKCATCDGPLNTDCLSCSGTFLSGGECLSSCPSGTYKSSGVCKACTTCTGGKYAATACSSSANTVCNTWTTCGIGEEEQTSPTSTNDRVCRPCQTNEYQDQSGQTSCKLGTTCSAGQYVTTALSVTNDRTCEQCAAGKFQSEINKGACLRCPAGRYQDEKGQSDCIDCGLSKYQPSQGQTSCITIPAGRYGVGSSPTKLTAANLCEAGYYCTGGSEPRRQCNGDTTYQDEAGRSSCKTVTNCDPGEYMSRSPTASSNTVCGSCGPDTFQSASDHRQTSCTSVTVCKAGQYQTKAPTVSSNRLCSDCASGKFSATSGSTSCTTTTVCNPGQYVTVAPTSTSDRSCGTCLSGTSFSATNNAVSCTTVQSCDAGSYEITSPTASNDRGCKQCDGITGYQDQVGQTACKAVTTCKAGELMTAAPTRTSNRKCAPCASGKYQSLKSHSESSCTAWSTCAAGTYMTASPTLTSDRACANCPSGQYQDQTNVGSCQSWSTCTAGTYSSRSPTSSTDRECTSCPSGTYRSDSSHTFTSCVALSTCGVGEYESATPTSSSDRKCAPCDGVNFFQDEAGQATCKSVATCADTEYVVKAATRTTDTQCGTCTTDGDCRTTQYLSGVCGGDTGFSNPTCLSCHPTCANCTGGSSSECGDCTGDLKFDKGRCLSDCAVGQFELNGDCKACHSTCNTCDGAQNTNCLSCSGSLYLTPSGTCSSSCPSGYFKLTQANDNRCSPCSTCSGGKYASSQCTATSNTVCTTWSECNVGEQQSVAPTSTTDRQCEACNGKTEFQDVAGQISCKAVTTCEFPDVENTPPAADRDRTCACDRVQCGRLVDAAYKDLICRSPDTEELSSGINSCCAGQSDTVRRQLLQLTQAYTDRHECEGCTSGCSCTQGFFLKSTSSDSQCVACDGITGYSDDDGATACTAVSSCARGQEVSVDPTPSSDVVCRDCPAGTIDHDGDGTTPCVKCSAGSYIPPGSHGKCSAFVCRAGTADLDSDPRTPCQECTFLSTFQSESNATACQDVTQCKAGEEEVLAPTKQSDRQCRACTEGVTFKSASGQATTCTSVSTCGAGFEEAAAPTVSSDRKCVSCEQGSTFKAQAGQLTECVAVSTCSAGEEEIRVPTIISDRQCASCVLGQTFKTDAGQDSRCASVTQCTQSQYQTVAATLTSDASCASLSQCSADSYQSVGPTPTSDRVCVECTQCPESRFVIAACTPFSNTQCQGCASCTPGETFMTRACTTGLDTICDACDECITGYYQTAPCTVDGNTKCAPLTICTRDEYEVVPPAFDKNRKCAPLTECSDSEYQSVAPAATTDRQCRPYTVCQQGEEETRFPGETQDRQCSPCQLGTTDHDFDGSTRCKACAPGTYVPMGSKGACSSFTCDPGTVDEDEDPTTPCTSCHFGESFMPVSGKTQCINVTECAAGEQQYTKPTLYTDRACLPCYPGASFKAMPGHVTKCQPVTQCDLSTEYVTADPTISSDRTCAALQLCNFEAQYESVVPTATTDRMCTDLTECRPKVEYESVPPDQYADRVCSEVDQCDGSFEYEVAAQTATSNRLCEALTLCKPNEYEVVIPTTTSNRLCVPVLAIVLYFDLDYSSIFSNDTIAQQFDLELRDLIVSFGIHSSSIVATDFVQGSVVATILVSDEPSYTIIYNEVARGAFIVFGSTATPCPRGQFLEAVPQGGSSALCSHYSTCVAGVQWASFVGNTTHDRVCSIVTFCQGLSISVTEPTATSDRICGTTTTAAPSTGASSSIPMIAGVVVGILVLIVIIAVLIVHNRRNIAKERERHEVEMLETHARFGVAKTDTLTGNSMLQFLNPVFNVMPELSSRSYFIGNASRGEAERKLQSMGDQPGQFVIRESAANHNHVLSMVSSPGVYEHHILQRDSRGFFQLNNQPLKEDINDVETVLVYLSQHMDGTTALLILPPDVQDSYGPVVRAAEQDMYGPKATEQDMYGPKAAAAPARPDWLKGPMNRGEAETALRPDINTPGTFLVRERAGKEGSYALSLVIPGRDFEHHMLEKDPSSGQFKLNGAHLSGATTVEKAIEMLRQNKQTLTCDLKQEECELDLYSDVPRDPRQGIVHHGATNPAFASRIIANTGYQEPERPHDSFTNPGYMEPDFVSSADGGYLDISEQPVGESEVDVLPPLPPKVPSIRRTSHPLSSAGVSADAPPPRPPKF